MTEHFNEQSAKADKVYAEIKAGGVVPIHASNFHDWDDVLRDLISRMAKDIAALQKERS